ncbi:MAG: GH116 family glycosyl hydrolase [Spirochaetota bacterium]
MNLARQFAYIAQHGYYHNSGTRGSKAFSPKPGSHDDGPPGGPFLGGIGSPAFGRNLSGVFDRWHLQPGYHAVRDIRSAQLLVWWKTTPDEDCEPAGPGGFESTGCRALSLESVGITMETAVLFPFTIERFSEDDMPIEVYLRFFSPVVPDDLAAAALPAVYIDSELYNRSPAQLEAAVALFWPNQLGWRQPIDSSESETVCSWPARGNYGNINVAVQTSLASQLTSAAVLQTRNPDLPVQRDLEGEVLLAVYSEDSRVEVSREISFKTEANGTGIPAEAQPYTFPWVRRYFNLHGRLPQSEESWRARCHEGLGSAVAGRVRLAPVRHAGDGVEKYSSARLHFLLIHDLPLVEFGGGRVWQRAYCRHYGSSGRNALEIAADAISGKQGWEESIQQWQRRIAKGSLINDLYFLVGGGTAWVSEAVTHPSDSSEPGKSDPGRQPHFALLEGFDTGYFYYNTFDLWLYAFPALMFGWQPLAAGVFEDYLHSVTLEDQTERIIYRPAERRPVLLPGKIPHDLGSAMEDPWYELNAYSWRDDPNVWRDHNPGFIVSYYLFRRYAGECITAAEYRILAQAAEYMLGQDSDKDGLPEHSEFGDSTWDALSLSGIGAYSGALAIGALAVMSRLSAEHDSASSERYRQLASRAVRSYQKALWNGHYFNSSSEGKYRRAIQADALFGVYLADLAGLRKLPDENAGPASGARGALLPAAQIRSHLLAVYEYNFRGYKNGRVGPLLVSNPERQSYRRDGGEDLQLDEVIVGSAWAYAAMLDYYGLEREAEAVETALVRTLYEDSGLQFRTPAAWDGEGRFRAPLNMRPLASWFLHLNEVRGRLS